MKILPESWRFSSISSAVVNPKDEIVSGPFGSNLKASEYRSKGVPIIRLQNIGRNEFIEKNINYISEEKAEELKKHSFIAGDVVVTKLGDPLGKATIVPETLQQGIIVADVVRIRATLGMIDNKYLAYAINSPDVCNELEKHVKGTTRPRVNLNHIRELKIPIAPYNEQKRIADKLDHIFEELDGIKSRLDKIPAVLKNFRTSILAQATSGVLTKSWRSKHGLELSDWESYIFKDLCSHITVGFVGKMSDQYTESGIPFLRSQNIRPFRYDPNGLKFISKSFHRKISKSALAPGDVAVVRSGAPGQCCVIPQELSEANCSDLVILRPNKTLLPEYACIYINSETSQSYVRASQVGIAQQHFNVGSMKITPIMLPPLEEQKEIARIVSEAYSLADEIERKYYMAIEHINEISQSVLNKAFCGELVSQNPNDEPASVLLERIKEEKYIQTKTFKSKSSSTSGKIRSKHKKTEGAFMTKTIQEVLAEHQDWLSAQEVFQLCGVGNGSQTEEIETLYAELRFLDKLGKLEIDAVYSSNGEKQYDRLKLKKVG